MTPRKGFTKPEPPIEEQCCRCGRADTRTRKGYATCADCNGEAFTVAQRARRRGVAA